MRLRDQLSHCFLLLASLPVVGFAQDYQLHTFKRQQLTDVYYSEGANAGDLNGDGAADVVYGPYWFEGPGFTTKHEIYEPVPQNVNGYADNFFSWVYDFNGDGWNDIFVVGFPGTPAYVYENPKQGGFESHWKKHQVFDWVSNESPRLTDLVGDERPELVCTRDGFFGFATIDWSDPLGTWEFHAISDKVAADQFGHGLGIGDVNGDGLLDVIHSGGWYEQPASKAESSRWRLHETSFSNAYGGAEMYAYDVDGDGDNDVITSHAAHDFGLGWYEQVRDGDDVAWNHHLIMGAHPSENRYGVLFSELHSVNVVDMDGDGLKDIVTGKTYWSHHMQSPMWDAGAVVYWFKLVRGDQGIDWVPYEADDDAGIGRQLSVVDVNNDGLLDMVMGGMKGAHVLRHHVESVSKEAWEAAQPKPYDGEQPPATDEAEARRGPKSAIDADTGSVPEAIEAESLTFEATAGRAEPQSMTPFAADRWSGDSQIWWTGARPGDSLTLDLPPFTGTIDLEVVLTCARDYGIVQLSLDDQVLGEPIDLYEKQVVTTGVLDFEKVETKGRKHTLTLQLVGGNPLAQQAFMAAVDYVRIKQADGSYVAGNATERSDESDAPDVFLAKSLDGRELNLDFESGSLDDWTATGDAFVGQPIQGDVVSQRREDMQSAHAGEYWIGGFERIGDAGTGTLTSLPFVVAHPYASFLTNGGQHSETRVELVLKDTGNVIYAANGENSETMRQVVADLRVYLGREIMIRLIDDYQGGWGHLNFDHFRFHQSPPGPVDAPIVVLVDDQYPHAGLHAEAAAEAMRLPEGFSVTVGAAEPAVQQPIAMAIDDLGRVWIAEAFEYPVRAEGERGRDRILIFEDTDHDGTLDQRTVFAEGLNLVSGLEVGFGGVWVGAAPYFMFIPDRDGDDVPDGEPEILLDGWGYEDTHETLNAFIWGPDGWLYGCHGVFTHSRVGKPGTPDEDRIPLNAAVWRYHPTKHQFEVFAHGTSNPWGVDFNDHGQAFITACVIPHLYHIVQGGRYQRQGGQHFNPYTYRDITTIADHLHYLGATPHGGNSKSDAAGGGHAHAGAMIYLGDKWPERYRNQLFMNNIHGQRLNVDVLHAEGSGYVGSHGPDFLLTGDQASQILNLRYGPDGDAWMIDWYDMQACHLREPSAHDRSNGRIYKISYGEKPSSEEVADLRSLSDSELAALALEANDWYVRHSRRLLQERAAERSIDGQAIAKLTEVATSNPRDDRRLRAAWALHVTQNLSSDLTRQLLADESPYVRGWAIQMAMESAAYDPSDELLDELVSMARSDPSPVVRLYLASAAQLLAPARRWELVEGLVSHAVDASDHNLPLLYWYAAEPLAEVDAQRAIALALSAGKSIPLLQEFMLRRIGSSGADSSLQVLVSGLGEAEAESLQLTFLRAIRTALRGRRRVAAPPAWAAVSPALLDSPNGEVRLQATALGVTFGDPATLAFMRSRVADPAAGDESRLVALQSLLDANDPGLVPVLLSLVRADSALAETAIRGLAQYDDGRVAEQLISAYPDLTPTQKRLALGTLGARKQSAVALLEAVASGQIAGTDVTADLVRQMQFLQDGEVDSRLASVWGNVRETAADKLQLIEEYKHFLEGASASDVDVELGRAMFAKTCMKCHTLYGVGGQIGPDLTGSNRSNLDYLLSNIVDPSAVMAKEYESTTILTADGRVVAGIVTVEDGNSVTLQTSDSVVIVPRDEIEERSASGKSMMPDDQLKQFTTREIASLIAYLQSSEQTAMLADPQNAATMFSGVDLTGWSGAEGLWSVDHGELVGRTSGLDHNEWIVSDLSVEDFKLTLEVKLVDDAGNSGIQFRSRAHDGEVAGYQADIGVGWWGKLYEEHGRALLWDQSGEAYVKPGDWNVYEIVAQGPHIQTFINGQPCVDIVDPDGASRGVIAFQLHSGGETEIRFRNIELEVLSDAGHE